MRLLLTIIFFFFVSFGWSQPRSSTTSVAPTKEKPKKEKAWLKAPEKPNETVAAAWAPLKVEHYVGIRGGYGIGTGRFEPIKQMASYMGLFNIGLSYKIDVPKQLYVGAIEFDIEYFERGYKYETYYQSGRFYSRKYSTITVPILWQPYLPFTKTGESRLYLNVGPNIGYAFMSNYEQYNAQAGKIEDSGKWEYDMLRDNHWEYGLVLGAGVEIAIKRRVLIGLDFRYNIMFSDTFKGVNKYPGNPFRSPIDVMNLSFKVEVRLNKNN